MYREVSLKSSLKKKWWQRSNPVLNRLTSKTEIKSSREVTMAEMGDKRTHNSFPGASPVLWWWEKEKYCWRWKKKKKSSHDNLASICQKACGIHKTKWKSFLWDDETKNKRSGFNFQCFRLGVFICWWQRDVDTALCCRQTASTCGKSSVKKLQCPNVQSWCVLIHTDLKC